MSPTIQVSVNGKMLIDTGSEITLLKYSTLSQLRINLNTRRTLPNLKGVTATSLRRLRSAKLNISVCYVSETIQWIPVVPDHYLETDLLLGINVLRKAPLTWEADNDCVEWGGASYPIKNHS